MSGTSRYEIDIIANNKAAKALSKTNRQLKSIDGNAKKANSGFSSMAKLAGAAAAAFGGFKLATSFLETAKQFENLGVQLKFITGNAKDGAAALGIVEAAAAKSAFAMSDMADAAPLLLTVGSVDQLSDSLDMVGDIAAATGLDFKTVAEQIQRAFSGGIASADIFREKGIKSMLGFQEGVQYSAAETEKHIRDAFENSTTTLKGATAEMAKTWTGQMSMMGDKWDQFKLKVMKAGLFPALKKHLGDLNKWFEDNKERIDEFAVALGEGLADAIIKIGEGVKFIADHADAFKTAAKALVALTLAKWLYAAATAAFVLGKRLMFAQAMAGPAGWASIGIGLAAMGTSLAIVNGLLGETSEGMDNAFKRKEIEQAIKEKKEQLDALKNSISDIDDKINSTEVMSLKERYSVFGDADGNIGGERFIAAMDKDFEKIKNILIAEIEDLNTQLSEIPIEIKTDLPKDVIGDKINSDLLDTGGAVDGLTKSYKDLATTVQDSWGPINTSTEMLTKLANEGFSPVTEMAKNFTPAITTSVEMLSFMAPAIDTSVNAIEIMIDAAKRGGLSFLSFNAPIEEKVIPNLWTAVGHMNELGIAAAKLKGELAEQAEQIQQLTDKYDPLGAAYRRTEEDMEKANELYKGREHLQAYKDLIKTIGDEQDNLTKRMEGTNTALGNTSKAFRETTEDIRSDGEKFVDDFNKDFNRKLADGLANGTLGFKTFAGMWRKILADLINDTLNQGTLLKDILSWLGGLFGGGGGTKKGSSPLMFAGPMDYLQAVPVSGGAAGPFDYLQFADGGHIAAGKTGIVGEGGSPELITGPATVTPMADLGSKPNVNISIQAIDTQTGTEFLLKNKKQIEGIIQNAYNRRGKQGIY